MNLTTQKLSMIAFTAVIGACFTSQANAATVTMLDFEGLQNLEPVQNFYNGGTGGFGSGPGTNIGVEFSSNALALIDLDAGGLGNIGGEPSPDTVLVFLTGAAANLNYASGFDTGFSFYYSAINNPGFVNVYDGLNATGNLLATINLPLTPFNGDPDPTGQFSPFVPIGVSFSGIARSVDFGGTLNQIVFDNITFGSDDPTDPDDPNQTPEGSSLLAFLAFAGSLGVSKILKKQNT